MAGGKVKKTPKSAKVKKAGKRGGRKPKRSFARYIFKIVKSKKLGVSAKGMAVLNSFTTSVFTNIAGEAAALVSAGSRKTMGAKEVSAATRFAVPGELGRKAALEGGKAIGKYTH